MLFTDEIRNMIYVPDLTPLVVEACQGRLTGILQVGGPEAISRFDFGRELCRQMGVDEKWLVPEQVRGNRRFGDRPPDLSLNLQKLQAAFPCLTFRTPAQGIADFLKRRIITPGYSILIS